MKSVIVFGGCFNPPTFAHQEIIDSCLNMPRFNEVWVMPSASGYTKKITTTDNDRIVMLELVKLNIFNNNPKFVISSFELDAPELLETCHTVEAMREKYSNIDFWFTFGSDSYVDMPNWTRGEQLQTELNMIIIERGGVPAPKKENVVPLELNKHKTLSSTGARNAVINREDLSKYVCQPVREYILSNNLYS